MALPRGGVALGGGVALADGASLGEGVTLCLPSFLVGGREFESEFVTSDSPGLGMGPLALG